jgi:arginase
LDVIDPLFYKYNSYQVENGLSKTEVFDLINASIDAIPLASATIASYDTSCDPKGKMLDTINELIETIVKGTDSNRIASSGADTTQHQH